MYEREETGIFLLRKVVLRSKRERLNIITSSQSAALTGFPLDFSFSGSPVPMASAEGEELADSISEAPLLDTVYLDRT